MIRNFFALAILCFFVSCGDEDENTVDFDQQSLINDLSDRVLLPTVQQSAASIQALNGELETFVQNPSLSSLQNAQEAWRTAMEDWKQVELFRFEVTLRYTNQIYFSPLRLNLVERALSDDEPMTTEYVERLGAAAKGLSTLEYLLFDFQNDNETVLTRFTTDELAARRLAYVEGIGNRLVVRSNELVNDWVAFLPEFKEKPVDFVVSLFANQPLAMLEQLQNVRLGEPLGKKTGTPPLPERVEAVYSAHSTELALSKLVGVEKIFTPQTGHTTFADYLDFVGATHGDMPLSEALTAQITATKEALTALDNPLQVAVVEENAKAEKAYMESQMLVVILKTEVFSALSLTISFTDADGD
ncbi:MAG: imelysin family protein [Bacteroidota bacterium]